MGYPQVRAAASIRRLVSANGDEHQRQSMGHSRHHATGAGVADEQVATREHQSLRNVAFDAHVRWQRPVVRRVVIAAERHEQVDWLSRKSFDERSEDGGAIVELRGCAERQESSPATPRSPGSG